MFDKEMIDSMRQNSKPRAIKIKLATNGYKSIFNDNYYLSIDR